MGAGVDDGVLIGIQSGCVLVGLPQLELQYPHSRKTQLLSQRYYLRGERSQILGDDFHPAEGFIYRGKELRSRALHPSALHGGRSVSGNFPEGLQASEVVNPHSVNEGEQTAKPLYPPAVSVLLHPLPAVLGIAPQLTLLAEVVGGAAGYCMGRTVIIQVKVLRVRPNIRTVGSHEQGQVTQYFHTFACGVFPEPLPLAVKNTLSKFFVFYPVS